MLSGQPQSLSRTKARQHPGDGVLSFHSWYHATGAAVRQCSLAEQGMIDCRSRHLPLLDSPQNALNDELEHLNDRDVACGLDNFSDRNLVR